MSNLFLGAPHGVRPQARQYNFTARGGTVQVADRAPVWTTGLAVRLDQCRNATTHHLQGSQTADVELVIDATLIGSVGEHRELVTRSSSPVRCPSPRASAQSRAGGRPLPVHHLVHMQGSALTSEPKISVLQLP